jgi:hypothetical protein
MISTTEKKELLFKISNVEGRKAFLHRVRMPDLMIMNEKAEISSENMF